MIIDRKKEIYYKVLAHTITEAEQFYDLLFASWRPMKTSGVDTRPSLAASLEHQDRRRSMFQLKQSGRVNSVFPHLFVTLRPSTDWIVPTQIGEDHMLISSRNTLTDTDTRK